MKLQPLVIVVSSIFLLTLVASSCGDSTTPTKQYTVTFNSNDGSTVSPIKVNSGQKATKPTDPTKANYNFVGWYKEAALTNLFDFNTETITASITLYAKFAEVPQYTVTFVTGDGATTVDPLKVVEGNKATKPVDPTRTNYNFAGWYKEDTYQNMFDFNTEVIKANMNLYAKWVSAALPKYTITFVTGTGASTIDPVQVVSGEKTTPPPPPTKSGYVLEGWYKDEATTALFDFTTETIKGNMNLYAKWKVFTKDLEGIAALGVIPADLTGYDQVSRDVLQYHKAGAKVVGHYVKVGGTGDGSSWTNAQDSVKPVLDAITPSDNTVHLVLVAKGTYQAGSAMTMKNNVAIIGGWAEAGGWTRNTADTTVLSGNGSYRVFDNDYSSTDRLTNTAVLYATKVADGNFDSFGGGMYNSNASPAVVNVTFSSNTAANGAGMSNSNSSPVLTNVTFSNNTATKIGGGMYNDASSPVLTNVVFSNNDGGGMSNSNSSPVLTNAMFLGNKAKEYGGGISNSANSSPVITNSTFSGNKAGTSGGGLANYRSSSVITNSIFWGNAAPADTQYTADGTSIYNSVVQGYSAFSGGVPTNNNVKIDPVLGGLTDAYGGYVKVVEFTGTSPVNIGLYVRRSKNPASTNNNGRDTYDFYYSSDKQTWYDSPAKAQAKAAGTAVTPTEPTVDLTATDATGQPRIGAPDAGAWEYR